MAACSNVWKAVAHVLCCDSPEGHVTMDFVEDEIDIGAKDTLSYSWRALKEARYDDRIGFILKQNFDQIVL